MSKNKKKNKKVVEIDDATKVFGPPTDGANALELAPESETDTLKTDKKILNKTAKSVRRLDYMVTTLYQLQRDTYEPLESGYSGNSIISVKDGERINEMSDIIGATADILFMLTRRMARKYVGKEISNLRDGKRKSLKK